MFVQNLSDFRMRSEKKLVEFSVLNAQNFPSKYGIFKREFGNIE